MPTPPLSPRSAACQPLDRAAQDSSAATTLPEELSPRASDYLRQLAAQGEVPRAMQFQEGLHLRVLGSEVQGGTQQGADALFLQSWAEEVQPLLDTIIAAGVPVTDGKGLAEIVMMLDYCRSRCLEIRMALPNKVIEAEGELRRLCGNTRVQDFKDAIVALDKDSLNALLEFVGPEHQESVRAELGQFKCYEELRSQLRFPHHMDDWHLQLARPVALRYDDHVALEKIDEQLRLIDRLAAPELALLRLLMLIKASNPQMTKIMLQAAQISSDIDRIACGRFIFPQARLNCAILDETAKADLTRFSAQQMTELVEVFRLLRLNESRPDIWANVSAHARRSMLTEGTRASHAHAAQAPNSLAAAEEAPQYMNRAASRSTAER